MSVILRPYQQEALNAINAAMDLGITRPLVVLPTGSGKTILFAELLRRRAGRALVLAHRDELLGQAAEKIRRVAPDLRLGFVKGAADDVGADVVVGSVQTLARSSRLRRLSPTFDTVIVDEAHHAAAPSYRRILTHVGAFAAGGPLTVGVTATPERADGADLVGTVWEEIVYRQHILPMIESGYLSDIRAIRVQLEANLNQVHIRGGDLVAGELEDVMRAAGAVDHVVRAWHQYAAGRTTLVFTPTVRMAEDIAAAFLSSGTASAMLSGDTPPETRRGVLARLRDGRLQVVTNCGVLTEGFDEPSIDCVVIARPTTSRSLYLQMIGRGARLHPGKSDCLLIDLAGSTARHDLMSAPIAFGMTEKHLEGRTVSEARAQRCVEEAQAAMHGELVAQAVDLFRRQPLNWNQATAGRYSLSMGDRGNLLMVSEDYQRWSVVHVHRDGSRLLVAQDLDLHFAQGTADDYVRRQPVGRALVTRDAAWRHRPATDKQLMALRRWRIRTRAGLTSGAASDLLAAAVARCA